MIKRIVAVRLALSRVGLAQWIKTLVALSAIGLSSTASAGSVTGATIAAIFVDGAYGSMVFVSLNAAKSDNPSCSTSSTYGFVLPLTTALDNQMLALLLAARTSHATVTLTGDGACDTYSNVETMISVSF